MKTLAACLLILLANACSSGDDIMLTVELRTDFRPGEEFVSVETMLDGGLMRATPATALDDYIEGVRIAELGGLSPGAKRVDVVLRNAAGEIIYSELTVLTLEADYGLRVVIARDCEDVDCPAGQKCAGERCVPIECHVDSDACGDPVCVDPTDCTASVPACVGPVCTGVACLWELRHALCEAGERCDAARGCVPTSPPMDGGMDTSSPDTGTVDTGAPDSERVDSAPADSALPDGGCTFRSDCPADDIPAYGGCVPSAPCALTGTQQRMIVSWQCAERSCVSTEMLDTRGCSADTDGDRCGVGSCSRCQSGVCTPLDGRERCGGGGAIFGGCREGTCCFGCWDGASCDPPRGRSDTQCGVAGLDCVDCTATGQVCVDASLGGACR